MREESIALARGKWREKTRKKHDDMLRKRAKHLRAIERGDTPDMKGKAN